jgi:hypothetical protein
MWAMAVNQRGTVVHDLQRPSSTFRMATSVYEQGGRLYFGSLVGGAVASVDRPASPDRPGSVRPR